MTDRGHGLPSELWDAVTDCREMLGDDYSEQSGPPEFAPFSSLLEQVRDYLGDQSGADGRVVSSLHHFACTGGTLIARCISAMPQVYVLSEVDPLSTHGLNRKRPVFAPTDILRHLRYSHRLIAEDLIIDVYMSALDALEGRLREAGGHLVVRDHTHSHYCTEIDPRCRRTHLSILASVFDVRPVLTVRDPVESYLSLVKLGWNGFQPSSFDEYCRRYILFLDDHRGAKIFKYERFVEDPEEQLQLLCAALGVDYEQGAPNLISAIKLTGDSGRGGQVVSPRPAKPRSEGLEMEITESQHYELLCGRLAY